MFGKLNIFKSRGANSEEDLQEQVDLYDEDEDEEFSEDVYEDEDDDDDEEDLVPVATFYTSTKLMSMRQKTDITDANDHTVYYARSKAVSLNDETTLFREDGTKVATIKKKVLSLHEVHFVEMENGKFFELTSEIEKFHEDSILIPGLGWALEGNITESEYYLWDEDSNMVACISQKRISLHDKYCIEIFIEDYIDEAVVILLTLQHMIRGREKGRAVSSIFGVDD